MTPRLIRGLVGLLATVSVAAAAPKLPEGYTPKPGDVVFQSFHLNPLTIAIEGSTKSPLSHCGIVAEKPKSKLKSAPQWVVIEAVGPVKETPLSEWIARGRGQYLAVYRFQGDLATNIPAILASARKYAGRPYDSRFRWDDTAIYCSELVHKAVRDATRITVGKMEKLGSLDWRPHEATIRALEGGPPPLDREMVTPVSIARDQKLQRVFVSGYKVEGGELVAP
jgi:Permuted papain-like amidase enzyme, YaeF/YiiX, C92 family